MEINWKVRLKNPIFYIGILAVTITSIMMYTNVSAKDLTTWEAVFDMLTEAVSNPYVLIQVLVGILTSAVDPTTRGIGDSLRALGYSEPNRR